MKPNLFNLRLLASRCNFSHLQSSVKVKWLNSTHTHTHTQKKNPWRRIEILFEKKPPLHKKFLSIYREVLSVMWPNFTEVKYNSIISIIYHQRKFRKGIMNMSTIKKLYLKFLQYSQKNTCAGVSFLNKNADLQSWNFIKKGFNTGVFLWILWNI